MFNWIQIVIKIYAELKNIILLIVAKHGSIEYTYINISIVTYPAIYDRRLVPK